MVTNVSTYKFTKLRCELICCGEGTEHVRERHVDQAGDGPSSDRRRTGTCRAPARRLPVRRRPSCLQRPQHGRPLRRRTDHRLGRRFLVVFTYLLTRGFFINDMRYINPRFTYLLTYLLLLLLLLQAFSALTLRLRLRMADPCTKFEVSSVSRCGDITWGVKF